MAMLINEKLKNLNTLSEAEKSVASQILELNEDIKNISIRELANLSFTSTSAVTRLTHKLGFNGYHEFKERYLEEIKYLNEHFDNIDANMPFSKEDNLAKVMGSISELYQESAKDTLSLVNYYDYIKAVSLIEKCTNVYILCIGTSLELGKIFADRMMKIGKNIIVSSNVNEQFYQSYNASEKDCFIVITYSGTTYKTKQFLNNIHKNKAHCILITSMGESIWKDYVDVILNMTTREKLYSNIASFTSTVSTMLILDMLYSCYFYQHFDENLKYKKEVAMEYEPNRKASQKIMEEDENNVFK
jgi:DNA-binding MurR/RpiR family transcriptional regulator